MRRQGSQLACGLPVTVSIPGGQGSHEALEHLGVAFCPCGGAPPPALEEGIDFVPQGGPRPVPDESGPVPDKRVAFGNAGAAIDLGQPALLSPAGQLLEEQDRKSTRLNSSHVKNSYAVIGLKK